MNPVASAPDSQAPTSTRRSWTGSPTIGVGFACRAEGVDRLIEQSHQATHIPRGCLVLNLPPFAGPGEHAADQFVEHIDGRFGENGILA